MQTAATVFADPDRVAIALRNGDGRVPSAARRTEDSQIPPRTRPRIVCARRADQQCVWVVRIEDQRREIAEAVFDLAEIVAARDAAEEPAIRYRMDIIRQLLI